MKHIQIASTNSETSKIATKMSRYDLGLIDSRYLHDGLPFVTHISDVIKMLKS